MAQYLYEARRWTSGFIILLRPVERRLMRPILRRKGLSVASSSEDRAEFSGGREDRGRDERGELFV